MDDLPPGISHYYLPSPHPWLCYVEPGNPDVTNEQVHEVIKLVAKEFMRMVGFSIQVGRHRLKSGKVEWHIDLGIAGPVGPAGITAPVIRILSRGDTLLAAAGNINRAMLDAQKGRWMTVRFGPIYEVGMSDADQYEMNWRN